MRLILVRRRPAPWRIVLLVALTIAFAAPAARSASIPCTLGAQPDLVCALGWGNVTVSAERFDVIFWTVYANACLAAPGAMVVEWTIGLADTPTGAQIVESIPTGEPGCPHRASLAREVGEGTFDPPVLCGQVAAVTSEGSTASWQRCHND